ncbi:hypothetical protein GFB56_31240 [Ensifer sp. T173]|uniref:Uncharacterized protein n=1 Tax=Ensifer canadensis TaxID=555315 RepID=A0AAW4FUX4_9HYPH|nr:MULTISPECIES: hypothetical protein [Ensifer]KQU88137.1 hypothetical protein ASD00_29480 [Ensifer sp. Root31]MBM3095202.1 hypothetical protein [Ensifer canadensis]UBI80092.1 hypothetical protein J3R84_31345 [Ensifer canadensis]
MNDDRQIPAQYGLNERGEAAEAASAIVTVIAKAAACPFDGVSAPCGQPCGGCIRRGRFPDRLTGGF